ncbi:hypothetical protein ACVMDN_005226 [Bradyrhizobium sp. USDA 4510]
MSDTPSEAPVKSILPKWVRGPQDFVGGLAMMAVALFALWASSDLQGMHGFSFGAGTAPRMFAVLLLLLGGGVALMGVLQNGPRISRPIPGAARCSYPPQSCSSHWRSGHSGLWSPPLPPS